METPATGVTPAASPLVGRANREGTARFRDWFDDLGRAAADGRGGAYVFVMGSLAELLRCFVQADKFLCHATPLAILILSYRWSSPRTLRMSCGKGSPLLNSTICKSQVTFRTLRSASSPVARST